MGHVYNESLEGLTRTCSRNPQSGREMVDDRAPDTLPGARSIVYSAQSMGLHNRGDQLTSIDPALDPRNQEKDECEVEEEDGQDEQGVGSETESGERKPAQQLKRAPPSVSPAASSSVESHLHFSVADQPQ
jgi:hypothetical protein